MDEPPHQSRGLCLLLPRAYIFYDHVNPQTKPKRSRRWQASGRLQEMRMGCAGWFCAARELCGLLQTRGLFGRRHAFHHGCL